MEPTNNDTFQADVVSDIDIAEDSDFKVEETHTNICIGKHMK